MKTFRQNSRILTGFLAVCFLFFFINMSGKSLSIGTETAEAKITEEISQPEENIDLDKNNPHIKKVIDAQKRHTQKLMEIPDVVGTATGTGEDNGPAILVFTKKKTEAGAIPQYLEDIPVTEIVTGEIFALKGPVSSRGKGSSKPTSRFAMPVPIGVSTGNIGECSAGTIGARLKDTAGHVYALSNNHVFALENNAPVGSEILQPGLYDTRCIYGQSNVIGTLFSYVPIAFNGGNNIVDAAIALSSTGQLSNSTPPGGYGIPDSEIYINPYIGQSVKKYGRTSRLTTGTINGINVTVRVCYNSSCSLLATFVEQLAISGGGFSRAGDSGSLIVTNDSNAYPIGLLFAGGSGVTFANPIDEVLNSFNMSVDGL
jgi:hypothetical protein